MEAVEPLFGFCREVVEDGWQAALESPLPAHSEIARDRLEELRVEVALARDAGKDSIAPDCCFVCTTIIIISYLLQN